ncbi:PEP-CTERM sorting domain-containing protein [Alteromonas sp. CYL-A6]|uniref:PEP-CTERM sorting domain-containing protein n=1 Tax=Alteromonas nitratireducens TaxID=3390813 RepID=UPI0034BD0A1C
MKSKFAKFIGAVGLMVCAGSASAGAIITDGNIALGVDDLGQLNVSGGVADIYGTVGTGLRYIDDTGTQYESTYHGCVCEGWGVAIGGTSETGFANNYSGTAGLSLISFVSSATTATSVVSTASMQITHAFALAAETDNLFRVLVTIENTSNTDIANLLYRRTFDWDTSPTPFDEYVTIGGTAAATAITAATDDGFCSSNPFSSCGTIVSGSSGDFEASGPADHGANFDFDFGALAAGDSFQFEIFYGGAIGKTAALAALGEVGAEAYSFGWSGSDVDQDGYIDSTGALAPTYIFGFAGVGGVALPDPTTDVDEPATFAMFGLAMLALMRLRRRG